ncbi:MAG: DUF3014 domain-containing protein [Porticoccaceae bacterium]|jgi:hypothetical protein|nr:DUF3014 domain-containing protein [Porticoccaceae bacterium]MDG1308050.1 DUF3014 domain-containing protein [Porticoccaceae bacterium]
MTRARSNSSTSKFILILGSLAAIAVIAGVLYQAQSATDEGLEYQQIPEQIAQSVSEQPAVPEALIPEPSAQPTAVAKPSAANTITPPRLPSLDDSDQFIRERLLTTKHRDELKTWLNTDDLVRRFASYLDGMARGVILSKIIPLTGPEGRFTTHRDGEIIWLNAGNYERYNSTVAVLTSLDMKSMAQMFHFIRPLLESAFAEMGYRPRQMDGIILQAIENILDTPIIVERIELTQDSVTYKFADKELEALLPLQKQLLRTGPESTQRIQQQALALKEALLNP